MSYWEGGCMGDELLKKDTIGWNTFRSPLILAPARMPVIMMMMMMMMMMRW